MCTYSWSRACKEVFEIHHMYLLTVTCNKINGTTCSVCNSLPIVRMHVIWWSRWYRVVLVRRICLWAPGDCFPLPTSSTYMVPCIPWWTTIVKAPPMVGPTWTRVHLTLGSDCSPTLFQGPSRFFLLLYVSFVVRACISDVQWSGVVLVCRLPICLCGPEGYTCDHMYVHFHGSLYPMMDCTLCVWYGLLAPMSADVPWGFLTILLLLAMVLGLRYFSCWYDNMGRCGL